MRSTRAKQLRRLSMLYANPKTAGLLHQGKVELFQDKEHRDILTGKAPWMIRIFLRKWAQDSRRARYQYIKRQFTRGKISVSTVNKSLAWFNKMLKVQHVTH